MIGLSVSADIPEGTDLLGKSADDLQSNIEIRPNAISGNLAYVDDYTGFSGDVSEQSGNYLALYCDAEHADEITVELVGGTVGHPVTLDSDGLIVIRITDPETQTIVVRATYGDYSTSQTYSLTGLELANA